MIDLCFKGIDDGMFRQLTKLQNLYLNNNQLKDIRAEMFVGLESLETLLLQGNFITNLNSGIFQGSKNLFFPENQHGVHSYAEICFAGK